jgi:hypothetical protein
MLFLQPSDIGDQRGFSRLDAAVIGVGRLRPALAGQAGIVQQGADILTSVPRIVFERQQVISTLLQQRLRGLARGMPGVECDRAACEREQRQPRPPGRNLVTWGLARPRSQGQPGFRSKGADQGPRRSSGRPVAGAPERRAVDGDMPLPHRAELLQLACQTGAEGFRIEQPDYPAEGVRRGRPVRPVEKLPPHLLLGGCQFRPIHAPLRPAQTGAESNGQNVQQLMMPSLRTAWVCQFGKRPGDSPPDRIPSLARPSGNKSCSRLKRP